MMVCFELAGGHSCNGVSLVMRQAREFLSTVGLSRSWFRLISAFSLSRDALLWHQRCEIGGNFFSMTAPD
jgi:hypothetical protein